MSTPTDKPQETPGPQQPLLKVVRGDATPEEVAAIVAVLASLRGGEEAAPRRRPPHWSAHHRKVRGSLPHGPGGWRSSGLPR